MAQTAKRSPGRPKSQTKTQPVAEVLPPPVKPQAPEKKKAKIVQKIAPPRNRVYKIASGGGVVHLLRTKNITFYDEDSNSVREIRYCPNENSIWVDEQSSNAKKEPIIFRDGNLIVRKDQPNLAAYLEKHPSNKKNGGSLFGEVLPDKKAEMTLESEFKTHDAVALVRDRDIQDLLAVAMYFGIGINRKSSEIKFDLLKKAKASPSDFIEAFDSPMVKTRATVYQSSEYQIINLKNDGGYWYDTNRLIVANPTGQDCLDTMTRFCLTERGATVLSSLEDQLSNIG